jgi:tetratricopeptide (TPR) repeat protein
MPKDGCRAWIPVVLILVACLAVAAPAAAQGEVDRESPTPDPGLPLQSDDSQIAAEIQKYWILMEENPYDASLHINLGNLYALWGWHSESLVEYNKAIALNPSSSVAWTNLGTLYNVMGKENKAIKAFKKALAANPNAALAYYNLATIYEQNGKYDKSVELYKRAVDLNPALASIEQNPQAVNNMTLEIVLLLKFQEQAGQHALPLHWIPLANAEESDESDAP